MKSIQHILLGVLVVGSLAYTSCKKDSPKSCNYATELQDETTALSVAANAYAADPSTANCNAYKAAFTLYLDHAEGFVDCATQAGQGAELQASIDQARASLDALQC